MLSHFFVQPSNHRRPWLIASALAVGGILFVPLYLIHAGITTLQHFEAGAILEPWGYISLWVLSIPQIVVFGALERYLLVSLAGIVLTLAALVWARPGRRTRVLLFLVLLAILIFPWFYRYQPAVVAAPGYAMHVPTHPGRLGSVAKHAQASTEITPCEYTLLGWRDDGTLYYQAACGGAGPQVWRFDPSKASSAQRVAQAPADLTRQRPAASILEWLRAPEVYPPEEEPNARRVAVQDSGLTSPDGHWVAVVVGHLYGPQDVVVLSESGH